jgi:hypothetical protein
MKDGAVEDVLFTADAVVQHQDALRLTELQKAMINGSVAMLQMKSLELLLSIEREQKALRSLLERRPIDTTAAAEQMTRLLAAEGQLKSLHFQLLVIIKNTLTDAQVARLNHILGRC